MTLFLTVLLSAAQAAPRHERSVGNEVSLELGTLSGADDTFELLTGDDAVTTRGLRGAYGLTDHLSLMGGVHHAAFGGTVEYGGGETTWDSQDVGGMAFYLTQLTLGPKLHFEPRERISLYGTAEAELLHGVLKMDSNIEEPDSAIESRLRDSAPGGVLAVGAEVLPFHVGRASVGTHLEMGYAAAFALRFTDEAGADPAGEPLAVGDVEARGFHLRWGLGVRF